MWVHYKGYVAAININLFFILSNWQIRYLFAGMFIAEISLKSIKTSAIQINFEINNLKLLNN